MKRGEFLSTLAGPISMACVACLASACSKDDNGGPSMVNNPGTSSGFTINLDSEFINNWCILESENNQYGYDSVIDHIENIEVEMQTGILSPDEIPVDFRVFDEPYIVEPNINDGPYLIYITESGETVTVPIETWHVESISGIATAVPEDSDDPP